MTTSYEMPGCCTAKVIVGFEPGEVGNGMQEKSEAVENRIFNETLEAIRYHKMRGKGLILATTTQLQVNAEAALQALGFHSPERRFTKTSYISNTLRLWYLPLDEFDIDKFALRPIPKVKVAW